MDFEEVKVILIENNDVISGSLNLFDESQSDPNMVQIDLYYQDKKISCINENYFDTLKEVRRQLEKENIQLICNGVARIVYPSAMQQSMGTGRVAYKLYIGIKARLADVVDIFDYDESLECTNIVVQENYFSKWYCSF